MEHIDDDLMNFGGGGRRFTAQTLDRDALALQDVMQIACAQPGFTEVSRDAPAALIGAQFGRCVSGDGAGGMPVWLVTIVKDKAGRPFRHPEPSRRHLLLDPYTGRVLDDFYAHTIAPPDVLAAQAEELSDLVDRALPLIGELRAAAEDFGRELVQAPARADTGDA